MAKKSPCYSGPGKCSSQRLSELFWMLGPAFARWTESRMGQSPGTTAQRMRILSLLHEHGALKMCDLKDQLGVTATNVTALIDALEKDELVARKAHPSDRRATLI